MSDFCPNCGGSETIKNIESRIFCYDCLASFELPIKDNKKLCKVVLIEKSYSVYYTQLEIDCIPPMLLKYIDNDDERIMERSFNKYYIFRVDYYEDLREGSILKLELDKYEYFTNINEERMYYDPTHFSDDEIQMLIDAN